MRKFIAIEPLGTIAIVKAALRNCFDLERGLDLGHP